MARLSKERDSALGKVNMWMNSCKQLEKEREALVLETQKLQASQTPGTIIYYITINNKYH